MKTVTVGIIPSPDLPAKVVREIVDDSVIDSQKHVDSSIDWKFETAVDSFIGVAEYVNESIDEAIYMKKEYNWDYAICTTDLPSISDHKAVISDVSTTHGAALISLPTFGAIFVKSRMRTVLTSIIHLLYNHRERDEKEEVESDMNVRFLFSKTKQVIPEENLKTDVRFILNSRFIGWLYILVGMVFANRPWREIMSFNKVITLAFATGTYISIFSTPWKLSVNYTSSRFIILMLFSIFGLVIWIILSHNLWEKSSAKNQNQYRVLYNITTVMTLFVITVINYIVLFALLIGTISLFVPEGLFQAQTGVDTGSSLRNLLQLSWLVSSLGLLAGAVGATTEREEKIRHITYSYRQLYRYYEIEKERENDKKEEGRKKPYKGMEQSHRESDTQ